MKLFLSSVRLPSDAEHTKLFGDKKHPSVTIIPNAWDPYPKDRRDAEFTDTILSFTELGYIPTVLDLITSDDARRESLILASDFIWVMGGNSFYLNYYVQKTSSGDLLERALERGVVYGGASAGAILVCPTLHGAEYADDPKDAPQVIWDGLGFIDFGIVPHWGLPKYTDTLEKVADGMRPYVSKVVTLTNDQAAVVIDGTVEIA